MKCGSKACENMEESSGQKEQQVSCPEPGKGLLCWRKYKEASVAGTAYLREQMVGNGGGDSQAGLYRS